MAVIWVILPRNQRVKHHLLDLGYGIRQNRFHASGCEDFLHSQKQTNKTRPKGDSSRFLCRLQFKIIDRRNHRF
ncbi:hypothetical protein L596_016720 [Steinernema carpocapsae]|uniref:Uncharacterized protein n=1 Tax=Steinernema carpocapsae TaxID=34508 RepID=A0A4U5NIR0_STECR|nr:hypothetical protein L596_016720 [Steinernema carpocapsae]